jgi:glycolate oxidase FAD binding subunit
VVSRQLAPATFEEALGALSETATEGRSVGILGAGTKRDWAPWPVDPYLQIRTTKLDEIVEHNAGDLTAVLQAGVPLARAQRQFASAGQMLALDPFLGPGDRATIGGIIASGDSGPLRHRYGGARDLILGMTVALSDGTIARSGGKVIKNVAGYDIGKLFAGSFGTLGLILSVNVRLQPLPAATATALGVSADPEALAVAARALAAAPLELDRLDVAWHRGRGRILAQCGGSQAGPRAETVARTIREAGLEGAEVTADDDELWAAQRAGQRAGAGALVRVAARPTALAQVLRAADTCGARLVGRVALGHSYLELEPAAAAELVARLPHGAAYSVLGAPPGTLSGIERWGPPPPAPALALMRRVKARFDPAGACNPGAFVGGI